MKIYFFIGSMSLSTILLLQWGNFSLLISCWLCMFAHWQRNDQSIIFYGRFILTLRDRITKKSIKAPQHFYKLICILMSEISNWPLCKTWLNAWWQNPCWQSQRSDVSFSWPPGCTHLSRDSVPLFADLLRFIKVLRLTLGNSNVQLHPQIF